MRSAILFLLHWVTGIVMMALSQQWQRQQWCHRFPSYPEGTVPLWVLPTLRLRLVAPALTLPKAAVALFFF